MGDGVRTIVMLCLAGSVCAGALGKLGDRRPVQGAASGSAFAATQPPSASPTAIALHADRNGHFLANAVVDGRSLPMLVDTGATSCTFTEEAAARLGIALSPRDFTLTTMTANGVVRAARVRIGVIRIGPVTVRDVEAVVIPQGRLGTNLLGMSFLKRVRDFSIAGGTMTLRG